jgi:hypothetical protein
MRKGGSRFAVLWHLFLGQFFASESVTSDHQLRQAFIGVLAFLITPGFLLPLQLAGAFEFAAIRFPSLLTPLIRLVESVFITYSMLSISLIAVFTWEALGFDRRDAMVLGPLPLRGPTIIFAKLAALGTVLLTAAVTMNILTALPFALIASNHQGVAAAGLQIAAHMLTTVGAATFCFSVLVTVRALTSMWSLGRRLAPVLQFVLVSAVLAFVTLAPTMLTVTRRVRGGEVHVQPLPDWSPTSWFLGLHEIIRRTPDDGSAATAVLAIESTFLAVGLAVLMTVIGYRRQMQLPLMPVAVWKEGWMLRGQRALARTVAGRPPSARALADFVLTTITRCRSQQVPIAINAAVAMLMIALGMAQRGKASVIDQAVTLSWSAVLMLAFWSAIGVRAAFFVPSDLAAAWTFHVNGPPSTSGYRRGLIGALCALIAVPAAVIAAALLMITSPWPVALLHGVGVFFAAVLLVEVIVLTIDFVPFTRPYEPGHAKLKTRWPLYAVAGYAFAYGFVALERWAFANRITEVGLVVTLATTIAAAELVGRQRPLQSELEHDVEFGEADSVMTLGLGASPY